MTRDEVLSQLSAILVDDFHVPADRVREDATFRGTLGMDSLDAVDFTYLVKKTFGLDSALNKFRDMHTVGLVADHILEVLATRDGQQVA